MTTATDLLTCQLCDGEVEHLTDAAGDLVCDDCLRDYRCCDHCGAYEHVDNVARSGRYTLCQTCQDERTACTCCGNLVETDRAWRCEDGAGRWAHICRPCMTRLGKASQVKPQE
jgi:hypothetical protein